MNLLQPYVNLTAWIASLISKLLYPSATAINGIINSENTSLQVAFGCDGTDQFIVFIAGVLAFPTDWNQKWKGLIKGLALLYFLNLFRIVGLLHIIISNTEQFDFFHEVVFPALFIFLSVAFWIYWLKNLKRV